MQFFIYNITIICSYIQGIILSPLSFIGNICRPSLSARSTRHLRSAEKCLLHVPFVRTSIMQSRPSLLLALWYGMVSHWISSHFLEYSPRNSFSNLKQHHLAALGLGALLSSPT